MTKVLKEINVINLGINTENSEQIYLRKSARAILLNKKEDIATQYLSKYTFHKLPGGGIEEGETPEEAVIREVLEEVGCQAKIISNLGVVIERRYDEIYISYGFVCRVVGEIREPNLEPGEIEEGQITKWIPATDLLEKMKSDKPGKEIGLSILEREKAFIREYLEK